MGLYPDPTRPHGVIFEAMNICKQKSRTIDVYSEAKVLEEIFIISYRKFYLNFYVSYDDQLTLFANMCPLKFFNCFCYQWLDF